MQGDVIRELVERLGRREQELLVLRRSIEQHLDTFGRDLARIGAALDAEVETRRQIEESLRAVAIRDHLTGLYNRQEMDYLLKEELVRYRRTGRSMTLVLVDIDGFEAINRELGHSTGDRVLQWVAGLLRDNVRLLDRTIRFNDDTFAVISPETAETGAYQMCERLRLMVAEKPCLITDLGGTARSVPVTVSLGIAGVPAAANTPETLVEAARDALLEAKHRGGNTTSINFGRPRTS